MCRHLQRQLVGCVPVRTGRLRSTGRRLHARQHADARAQPLLEEEGAIPCRAAPPRPPACMGTLARRRELATEGAVGGLQGHLVLLLPRRLEADGARAAAVQHATVLSFERSAERGRVAHALLGELRARASARERVRIRLPRPPLPDRGRVVSALRRHGRGGAVQLPRPAHVADQAVLVQPSVPVPLQHRRVDRRPAGGHRGDAPGGFARGDGRIGAQHPRDRRRRAAGQLGRDGREEGNHRHRTRVFALARSTDTSSFLRRESLGTHSKMPLTAS